MRQSLPLQKLLRWSERVEQTPGWQSSIECVPKVTLREKKKLARVDVAFATTSLQN